MLCTADYFMQESWEFIQIGQAREVAQFLWYLANCIKRVNFPTTTKVKHPSAHTIRSQPPSLILRYKHHHQAHEAPLNPPTSPRNFQG
jgi:glycogen synthase